jgi:hypothetical protein
LTIVWHRRCHLHVAELVTLPNVRGLDIRWPAGGESHVIAGHVAELVTHVSDLLEDEWILLLTQIRLCALRFAVWLCPSLLVLELAAQMPSLQSLSFACFGNEDPAVDMIAPLVHATQITSLELHLGWCLLPYTARRQMRKLFWLRDLKLRGAGFDAILFSLLFGSTETFGASGLGQLESLSLGGFSMRSQPYDLARSHRASMEVAGMEVAILGLQHLRTLTLSFVGFIDDALHALRESSSLRLLILHVRPHSGWRRSRKSSSVAIPSEGALATLLDSNAQLHIRIHCAKTKLAWSAHDPSDEGERMAQRFARVSEDSIAAFHEAVAAAFAPSEPVLSLSPLVSDRLQLLDELDEHRVLRCQYPLAQPLGLFGESPSPSDSHFGFLALEQARLERQRDLVRLQQRSLGDQSEQAS